MRIFLSVLVFTIGTFHSVSSLYAGNPQVQVDVGPDDGYYYDDDSYYDDGVVWVGPGWYYGVWFNTEIEFNDWRHGHHGGHGGHHGGHGGHHGGGGHHRGGGGGHHHSGGHGGGHGGHR